MAEFKPITDREISAVTVNSKKGLFVQDDVLSSDADIGSQKDRIMRNDAITEDLFVYCRELKAMTDRDIPVADVIQRLRNKIIADYPSDVRFV